MEHAVGACMSEFRYGGAYGGEPFEKRGQLVQREHIGSVALGL